MSSRATRRRILDILETDSTFESVELRDGPGYQGKCIHCAAKLSVQHDGTPLDEVTIEHIVPRARGGTDDLTNLALACARCNHQKGVRHDSRQARPRALEIEAALLALRRERWREPPPAVELTVDGVLDLHTFAPEDLGRLVPTYLQACLSRGTGEVRIVHGKGSGALRRSVRAILDRLPEVRSYRTAEAHEGGWGATVVLLEQR